VLHSKTLEIAVAITCCPNHVIHHPIIVTSRSFCSTTHTTTRCFERLPNQSGQTQQRFCSSYGLRLKTGAAPYVLKVQALSAGAAPPFLTFRFGSIRHYFPSPGQQN
jgi:hypothetical protein